MFILSRGKRGWRKWEKKMFIHFVRECGWRERKSIHLFHKRGRLDGEKNKNFQQFQKRERLEEEKDVEIKIINCSPISKKRKFGKHVSRSLRKYEIIDF